MSDITLERIHELLTEFRAEMAERLSNIEAKIESPAPKTTRAPKASSSVAEGSAEKRTCKYTKRNGDLCGKNCRGETDYCSDHPEGMTRDQFKKKQDGAPAASASKSTTKPEVDVLEVGPFEGHDSLRLIVKPANFKHVVVTVTKPHRYVCIFQDGKASEIDDEVLTKGLKTLGVTSPAPVTLITGTITKINEPKKTDKLKTETKKKEAPPSSPKDESEEVDDDETESEPVKTKAKPAKEEVDEPKTDKTGSDKKTESKAKAEPKKAEPKKKAKEASEDEASEDEAPAPSTQKAKKITTRKASKKEPESGSESD